MEKRQKEYILKTKSGREFTAQAIVAGIGLLPNITLAKAAGLLTGDGIVVDKYLLTSQADIYAAGDVAEFYNPALRKRMRVEHEDNALSMGLQAGRNMAGASEPYLHLPYFYSDLFELGYEAVGESGPQLHRGGRLERALPDRGAILHQRGPPPGGLIMECLEKDQSGPPVDQ